MNGIQKIIDRIAADSAAECAAIAAEADARREELKAEYSQAEQDTYWKLINTGAKETEQRLERLGSVASLEAKKQVLATKQEMVLAAFDRAAQLLSELPDDKYIPLLSRLAADASRTGAERLIFSERDGARVGGAVKNGANELLRAAGRPANLTLSSETRSIRGGVIVVNGDIESNCGADALVSQYRNELSSKVAEKLFN